MTHQHVTGWNNLRGVSRKFSTFPARPLFRWRERRLVHATERSVGGSMTLNLVTVSLWVTLRIATFRPKRRRSMLAEDRAASGRGAFPTRKLPWVIPPVHMHGNPREVQRVSLFFANYAIQRQSSATEGGGRGLLSKSLLSSIEWDCIEFLCDSLNRLFVSEIS